MLEIAAREGRILVTHDETTKPVHFAAHLRLGLTSPGVLLARQKTPVAEVIESLLLVWPPSSESGWADQIRYLPSLRPHTFR